MTAPRERSARRQPPWLGARSPPESLATTLAEDRDAAGVRAVAEGIGLATYGFSVAPGAKPPTLRRAKLIVEDPAAARVALRQAAAVVAAVHLARDLANTPSLEKSPDWLARRGRELCEAAGVAVRVRDETELAADGFGGIARRGPGVRTSAAAVRGELVAGGRERHVVLIGKGITFDSGGLSLKPPDGMVA